LKNSSYHAKILIPQTASLLKYPIVLRFSIKTLGKGDISKWNILTMAKSQQNMALLQQCFSNFQFIKDCLVEKGIEMRFCRCRVFYYFSCIFALSPFFLFLF